MLLDPSQIGGSREKIYELTNNKESHNFDGYFIEVHPNSDVAKTDKVQQLSIKDFEQIMNTLKGSMVYV
jgi:chorismate mutase